MTGEEWVCWLERVGPVDYKEGMKGCSRDWPELAEEVAQLTHWAVFGGWQQGSVLMVLLMMLLGGPAEYQGVVGRQTIRLYDWRGFRYGMHVLGSLARAEGKRVVEWVCVRLEAWAETWEEMQAGVFGWWVRTLEKEGEEAD